MSSTTTREGAFLNVHFVLASCVVDQGQGWLLHRCRRWRLDLPAILIRRRRSRLRRCFRREPIVSCDADAFLLRIIRELTLVLFASYWHLVLTFIVVHRHFLVHQRHQLLFHRQQIVCFLLLEIQLVLLLFVLHLQLRDVLGHLNQPLRQHCHFLIIVELLCLHDKVGLTNDVLSQFIAGFVEEAHGWLLCLFAGSVYLSWLSFNIVVVF